MTQRIQALYFRMIDYDAGEPKLIQHFTKVHAYARLIALGENMPERDREILEAAALVHDIAIPLCLCKYGSSAGKYQEAEGPALVREILPPLGFTAEETEKIAWLVGHHHTFTGVTTLEHRVLLEADFLVNAFEDSISEGAKENAREFVFQTQTGRKIFEAMYAL